MPIPEIDSSTGFLPFGDHEATWDEVVKEFGEGPRRRELLNNLRVVLDFLGGEGVDQVWIDGSFATAKNRPGDVDVIYDPSGATNPKTWGLYAPARMNDLHKLKKIDLWPHPSVARHSPGNVTPLSLHDFFATKGGIPKGMLTMHLKGPNP